MKTSTSVALLSLVSGIAAYPLKGIFVRSCQPGRLVCQGDGQFGICNMDSTAVFMTVAEGTKCLCSGADCSIAYADSSAQAPLPSIGAQEPVPAPHTASQAAAAPAPTQAAPQSSQAPAQASSAGGVFKDIPTESPEPKAPATQPTSQAAAQSTSQAAAQPTQTSTPDSGSGSSTGGNDIGSGKAYIKTFAGTGGTDASGGDWPAESQWADFNSMWTANLDNVISKSCTSFGQANNSPQESADMKSAIENVAKSSGVDARFILAIVMQESNGCVRAPTTNYGVRNPGLMQSHDGASSCYNVNPCSKETIQGMIEDGTNGTPSGDGLKQILAKFGGSGVSQFYKAARVYNSGSIAASGLLQDGIATHCYASDIANRLLGWSEGVGGCKN